MSSRVTKLSLSSNETKEKLFISLLLPHLAALLSNLCDGASCNSPHPPLTNYKHIDHSGAYTITMFFYEVSLGALYRYLCLCRAQILSGASSPVGLRSMSVLLVCAVMAHLEYNRHGCLDKARLVCLRVLFAPFPLFSPSFFLSSFFCVARCLA